MTIDKTQAHTPASAPDQSAPRAAFFSLVGKGFGRYVTAGVVLGSSMVVAAPVRVLSSVFQFLLTVLGMTLGVGLGLGLAMHVYEHLQQWQKKHDEQKSLSSQKHTHGHKRKQLDHKKSFDGIRPQAGPRQPTPSLLEDGTSYFSLMASAGYNFDEKIMRGQVLRDNAPFWETKYRFTDVHVDDQKGPQQLRADWPSLPTPVTRELGRFVEHVMRDYIAGWYSRLDAGCTFRDEREKRDEGIRRDGGDPETNPTTNPDANANAKHTNINGDANTNTNTDVNTDTNNGGANPNTDHDSNTNTHSAETNKVHATAAQNGGLASPSKAKPFTDESKRTVDSETKDGTSPSTKRVASTNGPGESTDAETAANPSAQHHGFQKRMVLSTTTLQRIPMLDQTYRILSAAFGNLATRAEHVNIFSLSLLKWTQVLAHTFKVYRLLRKSAQERNAVDHPTEIQITREFLLAGKLHRAVTFGLDVPSLLFADATGQECPTGEGPGPKEPDVVLEERLFRTGVLRECELDYNRVVAYRLVRALLPRSDSASHVVLALVVEIFGACVLQPLMNLWIPSFLNTIIVSATESSEKGKSDSQPSGSDVTPEVADVNGNTNASTQAAATVASEDMPEVSQSGVTATPAEASGVTSGAIKSSRYNTKERNNPDEADSPAPSADRSVEEKEHLLVTSPSKATPSNFSKNHEQSSMNGSPGGTKELDENDDEGSPLVVNEVLMKLTSFAITELQNYMDFEECRLARLNHQESNVDWDDTACQSSVTRLVLAIEAAMLNGRCLYRSPIVSPSDGVDVGQNNEPPTHDKLKGQSDRFQQLLMEMTSDMKGFEKRIDGFIAAAEETPLLADNSPIDFEPEPSEVSTLRTLISTWLHTGQIYSAIRLTRKAHETLFRPFYGDGAFLGVGHHGDVFEEEMKLLDGVDVMVETMAVLSSPRLDIEAEAELLAVDSITDSQQGSSADLDLSIDATEDEQSQRRPGRRLQLLKNSFVNRQPTETDQQNTGSIGGDIMSHFTTVATPRYLDFHRNSAFASSLRSERDRRMRSWEMRKVDEPIQTVRRKTAKASDIELHHELHNLSRIFYNGTNVMTIRDAARKSDNNDDNQRKGNARDQEKVSLLTVEMVSNRRRIEVPDDDSSFLLRAQPRPLNPVSVHRDDRNHDLSYKCFLATYEEPAVSAGSNRYKGGRFIRRCFLQYYPIDRTASVMLLNDGRKLDKRKGKPLVSEPLHPSKPASYLQGAFLRERHLCNKWTGKGAASQNFLSSAVMEATDFNATPRSGKALDFVYRMSLFERPTVELENKRFTVQDSAARGPHRADASALEVSDAALSSLLLTIGRDYETFDKSTDKVVNDSEVQESDNQEKTNEIFQYRHKVEMGPDGYPMIFMKFNRKQGDQVSTEIKPYRLSFVRAALLVTSARQEAQLQCLIECVRAGSAKSATKARTEAQLKPTLKLLHFANDSSRDGTRASGLLRDLKLGVYHIDRDQLRRNGLLNPRNPTLIRELKIKVEEVVQSKDAVDAIGGRLLPHASAMYKIRCVAVVELKGFEDEHELEPYRLEDGTLASQYREEWVVYRSMKDFQALHKQLKSEVAYAEASASTGSRLVGAAAAAFTNNSVGRRQRKALIPSLAQASKTGAIAVTKKALRKRGELLELYLSHLLAPSNILNRCMELLLFVGAGQPFPSDVKVLHTPPDLVDPLGRSDFVRSIASTGSGTESGLQAACPTTKNSKAGPAKDQAKDVSYNAGTAIGVGGDPTETAEAADDGKELNASILNKVDQVPLADVRNRLVELVRYQFGFENASFFRSRMLSALETASFVAITKASDFRKLLHDLHVQHLNPDALANWIRKVLDILWPNGVWLTAAPVLTEAEEANLRLKSQQALHSAFPESLRAILGPDLTRDGLDVVHEMLQNRVVVKSLFYMLFDLLWIEIFPELRDVMACASALDIE